MTVLLLGCAGCTVDLSMLACMLKVAETHASLQSKHCATRRALGYSTLRSEVPGCQEHTCRLCRPLRAVTRERTFRLAVSS